MTRSAVAVFVVVRHARVTIRAAGVRERVVAVASL